MNAEARRKTGLFAWAVYDWANTAFATVIQTFVFSSYFTRRVAPNTTEGSSRWGLTIGLAGIFVALCGPLLGAMADQKGRRKPWLIGFTLLCAAATACLWYIPPQASGVKAAMILVWVAVVGAEFAAIFYNAMLPHLAPSERTGRWSGWGWALGYAGGLSCLLLAYFAFVGENPWFALDREQALHVRATFPLVAVWLTVFSIPLFLLTPDEPKKVSGVGKALRDGWHQLIGMIRNLRGYMTIVRFLIARMIYIDGLATIFAFGGVYAAGTFGMKEQDVLLFGVALNISAGIGAFAFSWIDDWLGSRRTILLSLVGLILPGIGILVVQSTILFWVFGIVLGIFVGPVQSASRSYLAHAAPKDLRNQMFGLYAFSGKATAFVGPLAVGGITQLTGSQRFGMSAVFVLLAIGAVMMWTLPESRE